MLDAVICLPDLSDARTLLTRVRNDKNRLGFKVVSREMHGNMKSQIGVSSIAKPYVFHFNSFPRYLDCEFFLKRMSVKIT